MNEDSYFAYLEELNKNPFIKMVFVYIIPYLFKIESKEEKTKEENKIKTGIQALIDRNKKNITEIENTNNSFEKYVISFMYKSEQNYDIVEKITYTYLNNIVKNISIISEEDKKNKEKKDTKPIESISTKIAGRSKDGK